MVEVATLLHVPRTRRLSRRKSTFVVIVIGAVVIIAIVVLGQLLTAAAQQTDFSQKSLPPSFTHPFGTDQMGRDMLARTIAGLSLSILVGLGAACVSAAIAVVLGTFAALGGKRADAIVTWLTDLMMGIPHIVLLILISFALGGGFVGVVVGVALTHWPSLTRVIRAEILQCRTAGFITTAQKLGVTRVSIAIHHMVPYILPQLIIGLILLFPHAILHEAAITFLGFGLPPEQPAIGIILSESMAYLSAGQWWLAVFPGLALIAIVMMFDAVGSGIRTLVDPASSQE